MICLTFDTDHMDEARMGEFLANVSIPGNGTFFCTQRYDCLERTDHEIAPHPCLVEKQGWYNELMVMRNNFPMAVGWRSHSCIYSHLLAEWIGKNGYFYASTSDRLGETGLEPVREAFGVWQMPIYYMDNLDFSNLRFWGSEGHAPFDRGRIARALSEPGLYVFDFHPVHLLLNSPNYESYAAARDKFKRGDPLETLTHKGEGTRSFYDTLVAEISRRGTQSMSLEAALQQHLRTVPERSFA